jgi:HSP20 family molecular chaperone IbpA
MNVSSEKQVSFQFFETDADVTIEVGVVGYGPRELAVNLEGRRLTISGETKIEEGDQFSSESFLHSIDLPAAALIETVEAIFQDGVLKVQAAKAGQSGSRVIQIKIIEK